MSLVGPRPIVRTEIRKYGEYIHDFYLVRPGITGVWQVSGRSDTPTMNAYAWIRGMFIIGRFGLI